MFNIVLSVPDGLVPNDRREAVARVDNCCFEIAVAVLSASMEVLKNEFPCTAFSMIFMGTTDQLGHVPS
jgi:hypothetical protein